MNISKIILKWILSAAMVLAGINHFLNADFYLRMMPPILPQHLFLIYLSGIFEIALGVLLLIPKFTRLGGVGFDCAFVGGFSGKYLYGDESREFFPEFNPTLIYLQLPLQFVLIAWAFWFTQISRK